MVRTAIAAILACPSLPRCALNVGLLLALAAPASAGRGVGTDLASLNLCLYGDCEARGTYAADPFGLSNPGTLAFTPHSRFLPRGAVGSGSYFRLHVGDVDGDLESGVATVAWNTVVFQVATAYAEADGPVAAEPGVTMHFRTRAVRLAAGIDAEAFLGIRGLSLGLAGIVPGTKTDVSLAAGGVRFVDSTETRDLELVPGFLWHTGVHDWLMVGGFLDVVRNGVESRGFDPITGTPFAKRATTNVLFARAGVSTLPLVPFGLADGDSPRDQWLTKVRLATDVEYRNISAPGEGNVQGATGFFGLDVPLVPDAWNPLAGWMRVWLLGGVDTRGGWGVGGGLYGNGPLKPFGCNPAYSSRPLADFIGDRVKLFAITCSVMVPL